METDKRRRCLHGTDRFFGPVIGRFGNRIDHASFEIDGVRYDVVANETLAGEPVQCHGGPMGFDRPTVVNLSNHTHYCPDLLLPVDGSPFDFREPHRIDYRIDMPNEHLRIMKGMSACWAVRDWDGTLRKAADLYDEVSGRGLETIHFPDSPNQDRFPSTVLRPGERYHSETEYRFYTK